MHQEEFRYDLYHGSEVNPSEVLNEIDIIENFDLIVMTKNPSLFLDDSRIQRKSAVTVTLSDGEFEELDERLEEEFAEVWFDW